MNINFVVGQIISILCYAITILFPKAYAKIFNDILQIFNCKTIINKSKIDKVSKKFVFLMLFIVVWITVLYTYKNFWYSIGLYKMYYNHSIYKFGIAILFFLIGIFVSEGKNIIGMFQNNLNYLIKTFLLTAMYVFFHTLYAKFNWIISIVVAFIILCCIIDYYHVFKEKKDTMPNSIFAFNFLWFMWILFHTVFIFVNVIINV